MNFREASRRLADLNNSGTMEMGMTTDFPIVRPVINQPNPQTDGLDPAALGGSSPYNSGVGPYADKVVTDPLVPVPTRNLHGEMPHEQGPDVDTTTLKSYKDRG